MKNPYHIIKSQYVTEKSKVLEDLKNRSSNPSLSKCNSVKYVFEVDSKANKCEIRDALLQIFKDQKITVRSVNTINVKKKKKRTVRGRAGEKAGFKKAIVTLGPNDNLEDVM